MNKNLIFDFSVNKENKTIEIKREFEAELPLVWDAYTKSEILDQWWAPKPWKAKTKSMDFKEGGKWIYAMVGPKGEEHWSFANYSKINIHKGFTAQDGFSDSNGKVNTEMPQSKWNVSFTSKGNSTLVEIVVAYNSLEDLDAIIKMGFKEGMTIAMEGLDELLPVLKNK